MKSPANTRRWFNAGSILGQRRGRVTGIKATLFAWYFNTHRSATHSPWGELTDTIFIKWREEYSVVESEPRGTGLISKIIPPLETIPGLDFGLYPGVDPGGSQKLLLHPRIYPRFQQIYMCDPLSIYLSLPKYTLLFNNYMRPSQHLPLSLRIYHPFQQLYATLPESTPPIKNIPLF